MRISCVILTRNEEARIAQCIDSLLIQKEVVKYLEVIIVDGHSTDSTREIVKTYVDTYSEVKLIECHKWGYSYQRNIGVNCANGDYILFISGDAYSSKNLLKKYVSYINLGYEVIQGSIINISNAKFFSKIMRTLYPSIYSNSMNNKEDESFSTVNVLIKKDLFNLGKFNESINSMEDKEWFAKIQSLNKVKFIRAKGAAVHHHIHEDYKQYSKKIFKEAVAIGNITIKEKSKKYNYFGWLSLTNQIITLMLFTSIFLFVFPIIPNTFFTIAVFIIMLLLPIIFKIQRKYPRNNTLKYNEKIALIIYFISFYIIIPIGITKGKIIGLKNLYLLKITSYR
ncbi:glycosyltransferase [Sutcliffiella sp. BMC8]